RPHRDAVEKHVERLAAALVGGALGGRESDGVGAAGEGQLLAEAAGVLQEGDLSALRGRWVARREAAAVARDARLPHEGPRRGRRVILVGGRAGADRRRLEAAVLQ